MNNFYLLMQLAQQYARTATYHRNPAASKNAARLVRKALKQRISRYFA